METPTAVSLSFQDVSVFNRTCVLTHWMLLDVSWALVNFLFYPTRCESISNFQQGANWTRVLFFTFDGGRLGRCTGEEPSTGLEHVIWYFSHWCNNATLWLNGQEALPGPPEAHLISAVTHLALLIVPPVGRARLHLLSAALFISVSLLQRKYIHVGKQITACQNTVKSLLNSGDSLLLGCVLIQCLSTLTSASWKTFSMREIKHWCFSKWTTIELCYSDSSMWLKKEALEDATL